MRHFEEAGSSKPSLNIKKQPKTAFLGIKSCAKLPRSKIIRNDLYHLFVGLIWDLCAKFQPGKKSFFWPLKREIFAGVTIDRLAPYWLCRFLSPFDILNIEFCQRPSSNKNSPTTLSHCNRIRIIVHRQFMWRNLNYHLGQRNCIFWREPRSFADKSYP